MEKKEFGLWFWIHIFLLVPTYLSPFFIDWKLIIVGVALLQLQYWVIDGCVLTHLEMGKGKNETFLWYYLRKIYPHLSPTKTKFVIRIIVPIILVLVAVLLQVVFGLRPFVTL